MIRRKHTKDPQGDGSNTQVPMGDAGLPLSTQTIRRRKKKTYGIFRTCLIRLRILSDRRKKIDSHSISGKRGATGTHRGGEDGIMYLYLSSLVSLLMISFGLYKTLEWLEGGENSNLILPATANIIPIDLFSSLGDLRPTGKDLPVVFYKSNSKSPTNKIVDFNYPDRLHHREAREAEYVDFGDIDLKLLATEDQKRQIYIMVEDLQGDARSLDRERDDDMEMYWAFDDDIERNPYTLYDEYSPEMEGRCRRLPWHRYLLSACNHMHELDLVSNTPRFVGDGAYREVFVTEQPLMGSIEEMIFKELRWDLNMDVDDYEYVRMDAFVTERLTSHKQITDIYGYCGLSMLTEFFPYGDIEKDVVGFQHHRKDFKPWTDKEIPQLNNFTGAEKLQLALNMVEPVAALHNYPGGVIVHDDIQLCQYLWTEENGISVKLNDFNRAEIMLWDETAGKYCRYKNGRGHGDWRAPEEYKDRPLDEKIDIWSLGNNMYSVLTGYYPFADVEKDRQIQKLIKDGETAVIDPRYVDRSFAESKLIEVIQRCYAYDPDKRADINEIWQMLKDAVEENEKFEEGEANRKAASEQREQEEEEARAESVVKEQHDRDAQQEAEVREAQARATAAKVAESEAAERQAEAESQRRKEVAPAESEVKEQHDGDAQQEAEVLEAQARAKAARLAESEARKRQAEAESQRRKEDAVNEAEEEEEEGSRTGESREEV